MISLCLIFLFFYGSSFEMFSDLPSVYDFSVCWWVDFFTVAAVSSGDDFYAI